MAETRLKIDTPFTSETEIAELVRLFESCELPYERWTHRAHLAVAVAYLERYPLAVATDRARTRIPQYNNVRGDGVGYHETITVLYMRLVERVMRVAPDAGRHDLVNDLAARFPVSWLLGYYSPERLWSPEARAGFVSPDLRELDF